MYLQHSIREILLPETTIWNKKCASELYQSKMCEMIEDIEGAEVVMDDILIWGRTLEEHDRRLKQVLDKARKYYLKLSKNKCEFRKKEVTYVAHVLSDTGVKIDYKKLRAVEQMTAPINIKELQHFLGFIQTQENSLKTCQKSQLL